MPTVSDWLHTFWVRVWVAGLPLDWQAPLRKTTHSHPRTPLGRSGAPSCGLSSLSLHSQSPAAIPFPLPFHRNLRILKILPGLWREPCQTCRSIWGEEHVPHTEATTPHVTLHPWDLLITGNLYLLTAFIQFSHPRPTSGNHRFDLFFYEFILKYNWPATLC